MTKTENESMGEVIHTYEGRDWEAKIQKLLKLRYKLGDYQEIPDKHVGDFGLEGFSRDGCAFQCYAAEEPVSTQELYEKQRKKIAQDIKKFIDNRKQLEKIFDGVSIHYWLLVVPRFDSAQLVAYARSKAEEVRLAKLPYVADDFHIGIVTDENFAPEIQTLARSGGIQLELPLADPDPKELEEWAKNNSPSISTMDRKIKNIKTLTSQKQRSKFRDEMIRHFLVGQNALSRLKTTYPDLYEEVVKLKDEKESFLVVESLLSADPPNKTLTDTITTFTNTLEAKLPGVAGKAAKTFAFEAASDWLLRCPLDFPAGTS
jgi:hypothetical protein